MSDFVITISRTDPKFQSKLKQADRHSGDRGNNGLIDTEEERMAAGNLVCAEKPKNQSAAETCLKQTLGIETANTLISWEPSLFQSMDRHEGSIWEIANWSNGGIFNCTWRPSNIKFENGFMKLILNNAGCPSSCKGMPYASGEYRTQRETFSYGYYEVRMKAASGEGLVAGTFFTYRGKYGERSHDEIDFEFLGKNPRMVQLNFYTEGRGVHDEHKKDIFLNFDASQEFHNYGFKLAPNSLTWYIDGRAVHTATAAPGEKLPYRPMKIMANFWPGSSQSDIVAWLGGIFKYPGRPLQVEYDWIKFSPLKDAPQPTAADRTGAQRQTTAPQPTPAKPASQPAPAKPAAPGKPLNIENIQQGSFDFNNGKVNLRAGSYTFSANQAKDPGFGILTGNVDLQDRNSLKFDIKGDFKKHGGWARLIVQVYSDKNNDYSPSVSLDPIELKPNFTPTTVDLHYIEEGKEILLGKAKKVQFLLVTDKGSCQVEIKNIRFE